MLRGAKTEVASLFGKSMLAISNRSLIRRIMTTTRPGRALATRFVAGEDLDDAVAVSRTLIDGGASVSLDHLGEHVAHAEQALAARDDYLKCLERIGVDGLDANISIKLTQLGLGFDDELAAGSLDTLAERAAAIGTTVTIDMEESAYTQRTIDLFEKAQATHGNLGVAVQAYLRSTPHDLDRVIAAGGHVRLCKGAYAEPSSVAYTRRAEVEASFDSLTRLLMSTPHIVPAIATHDDDRLELVGRLAKERRDPYEYQMLYGVHTRRQRELLATGLPLRVYVPYGAAWYPYLTRRLAERPANLWFFLRALFSRR